MNYFWSSGICFCMTRRNGFGFLWLPIMTKEHAYTLSNLCPSSYFFILNFSYFIFLHISYLIFSYFFHSSSLTIDQTFDQMSIWSFFLLSTTFLIFSFSESSQISKRSLLFPHPRHDNENQKIMLLESFPFRFGWNWVIPTKLSSQTVSQISCLQTNKSQKTGDNCKYNLSRHWT